MDERTDMGEVARAAYDAAMAAIEDEEVGVLVLVDGPHGAVRSRLRHLTAWRIDFAELRAAGVPEARIGELARAACDAARTGLYEG